MLLNDGALENSPSLEHLDENNEKEPNIDAPEEDK